MNLKYLCKPTSSCVAVLLLYCHVVQCFEPVTTVFGLGAALGAGLFAAQCQFKECCQYGGWVQATKENNNMTGLANVFKSNLHGQHLVVNTVFKILKGHLEDESPSKALVISMHGWTGGGKNYVSKFIAEHIYSLGLKSSYVQMFIATLDFPHQSKVDQYKDRLSRTIQEKVKACERTLFIFDEMDKLPKGLIDSIKPFIDTHPIIAGVDYRKAIFLFLSNAAGNDITKKTLEHWRDGKKREDITQKEMEEVIQLAAYNEDGGLYKANILEKHLVSAFVPFLPMERKHVKMCIKDDLRMKGHPITERVVNDIADELQYFPADSKVYSTSGCKRVSEKVNFMMEDL